LWISAWKSDRKLSSFIEQAATSEGGRMTTNREFNLTLETLDELQLGIESTPAFPSQPTADSARLREILAKAGPLPPEALFLGLASDGLPVLLNLHDALPGPLLVLGDEGAGKTSFLQSIAQAMALTHDPIDAQFAVLTTRPEEWEVVESTPHMIGIFDLQQENGQQLVQSLAAWAHSNKDTQQSIVLLVDDLESIAKWQLNALQHFRWLLLRGTARRVWPIVAMNASRYGQVIAWIDMFRTRVFGRVGNQQAAEALGADKASALDRLDAGRQFSLREGVSWLQFNI
jgi:hypothetical protein